MRRAPREPAVSLVLRDLHVERGGRTLLVADLAVHGGECSVVIGSAGTGKSSLAAAIAGVLPASGVAEVAGRRLSGPPARRRRLGLAAVLPDESAAHGCTVAELLGLAARRPRTAAATLERFPLLGERSGLDAGRLSGGERQLLRLAAAWAGMPVALLLDGPAAGLADDVAAAVREIALEEARRGAAVLWLDQPDATVPVLPRWVLEDGRVRTSASVSGSGSA
jgi:branched-chain amino acid transport system ATP-binding protein